MGRTVSTEDLKTKLDRKDPIKVVETDLTWDDHVVYHQPSKSDSFAWKQRYMSGINSVHEKTSTHLLPICLQ